MSITVRHLLDKKGHEVHSVAPNATVFETIELMSKLEVAALLVIERNKLAGIITERDCTQRVVLKERPAKLTLVTEIMTENLICVSLNNNISECMEQMNKNHIRHLPVVDRNVVKGIISIMDVIKNTLLEKEATIEQMEDYITGNA